MKSCCCFLLTLLCAVAAQAHVRLVEWHTKNAFAPFILPVRDSETPEEASERYFRNLDKNPDLMELFQGRLPQMETVQFKELSNSQAERDRRLLLQANRPGDYTTKEVRADKFVSYFRTLGQKPYLLLLNPSLGLSRSEEKEVFDLVYEKFAIYAGMGGDDVDPALAKQENFHSRNIISERDQAEMRLVQHFIRRGQEEKDPSVKSFYFGTCRGSQLASIALGYKMIQDLPFQVGKKVSHAHDWHAIEILNTSHGIFNALGASQKITVNSLHHQAVRFVPGGFLEQVARAEDGTHEGAVFKNGKGALLQFHAELMNNALGFSFLKEVIRAKEATGVRSCSGIFAG